MSNRMTWNFWLDLLGLVVMLGLTFTGGLVHYILPPGAGRSALLWGLDRHQWGQIHFYLAWATVVVLVLHLVLHWSWICCTVARLRNAGRPSVRAQRVAGLALTVCLSLLIGGGLVWARGQVKQAGVTHPGERGKRGPLGPAAPLEHRAVTGEMAAHCPAAADIRGRITIGQAASSSGLSVPRMLRLLGLPDDSDPGTRLGQIRRGYGLSMEEVRRLVCEQGRAPAAAPALETQ